MVDPPSPYFDYDTFQQFYALSAISNAAGFKQGDAATQAGDLKKTLTLLPHIAGQWTVAWGPAVVKSSTVDTQGPDNAWFVAVDDVNKLCVVAIAGTSGISTWAKDEDVDVSAKVDFDQWVSGWTSGGVPSPPAASSDQTVNISHGTALFVVNILNTPALPGFAGAGTVLGQYLQTVPSDYKIIFTGHSMGGAVAPTIALGLVQKQILSSSNVYNLPTAGASPGNAGFAAKFAQTFPVQNIGPERYQVYNTDYYNTNDVVPQAWSKDTDFDRCLQNIKKIYQAATGDAAKEVDAIVFYLDLKAGKTYVPLQGTPFTGPPVPAISAPSDLKNEAVTVQHIDAYWTEFGIADWTSWFPTAPTSQLGTESDTEGSLAIGNGIFEGLVKADDTPTVGGGIDIDPIKDWI